MHLIKQGLRANADILAVLALFAAILPFSGGYFSFYRESLGLPLLCKLFCIMTVVAGMREYGILNFLVRHLLPAECSLRRLGVSLTFGCFFLSMAVTNDVSLIMLVPLTLEILRRCGHLECAVWIVTLQTIAANMGSMLTPMGNPQNLFIFEHYHVRAANFLQVTLPVTVACALLLSLAALRLPKDIRIVPAAAVGHLSVRVSLLLGALFALCLAAVFRALRPEIALLCVLAAMNLLKGRLLLKADFHLLGLFVALFLLTAALSRLEAVQALPQLLKGHVYLASVLLSQAISNVPAAVLLSHWTSDWQTLLLGVSCGGLGTLIASMASLISWRAVSRELKDSLKSYFWTFTLANAALLLLLSAALAASGAI